MSTNDLPPGSNPEPCFPPELERDIFETAAVLDAAIIPLLLRICRRVQAWVEPLLYRVLTTDYRDLPILRAAETKSASFLHTAVRHLFLEQPVEMSESRTTLLKNCTGVTNLYFDGALEIQFLDILGDMRLRKLSLSAPREVSEKRQLLYHPTLRFLTHLDLVEDAHPTWEDWRALATLPELTHLSLSQEFPSDVLQHVLDECPQLAVAVIAFWAGWSWERDDAIVFAESLATTVTDSRMVVLVVHSYDRDWQVGARGGDDFWIRAEAFIDRKRRGQIDKGCHFLDDLDVQTR
ncbi:hypothetical protein C8R47DRAFT_167078 [Mycena vitilis]|nr:hypothetical protein C8R47DRAFT_167078 [Mycena vitilis]